ncbi:tetratricopeptide repeat protein [Kutzneria buriramensis]|uniref:Tetratricopeptide repeat protein n=1 Tax=Kutzneria buriramensis TaxID=1045776 RepID=A0A3E0HKB9_9PSEU|nr:tetratricopeptide repeat protein [Kutzneria buriramensis]REH46857.1 tetratricopeptide repeat protein [Kutzneria buriramensis]
MRSSWHSVDASAAPPDPGSAEKLDDLVERLRSLKVWAGDPSYEWITGRVNSAWSAAGRLSGELAGKSTVADCFRLGRRRVNVDLVVAIVQTLHPNAGYVAQWRQKLRVLTGEIRAAAQVRVQDALPRELPGFTGRAAELGRLWAALQHTAVTGGAVVVSAIAGAGKTQLAVRAGHLLVRDGLVDRVLFVDLRGFHPSPAQPAADPSAVLDGFLQLLGLSGQQIPHDLPARSAAYRARLAGTQTLVVLDNAADADQILPLLPRTPGCPALITSRRALAELDAATHLAVDVFAPEESTVFLTRATIGVPAGSDPRAVDRIARRCGHLPLALGLVAGHIRGTPGWTLTDHADRLDERHRQRRLDTGVELAFDLSYQDLPAHGQRLLRLTALHPGQDLDDHAAAAVTGSDLPTTQAVLSHLCRDHLLQEDTPGRYTMHDLVRTYATGRADDEDPPRERHAALTRLFDYYLATAATAMDTIYPAEAHRRPRIPAPATPAPDLSEPGPARAWLDTERPTLVAVAAHTATQGWPAHTTRLSATLFPYLATQFLTDSLAVHGHALHAASRAGDPTGQARALTSLGFAQGLLSRYGLAAEHLQQSLRLFRQAGDPTDQARTLASLGAVEERLGRYQSATEHLRQALTLHRNVRDRTGKAFALNCLGVVEACLGRYRAAADSHEQALALCREEGDHTGEAGALRGLGIVEVRLGRYQPAGDHLQQALVLYRRFGSRLGEARTLDCLGILHTRLGQPAQATEHHLRALAVFGVTGDRDGEAWALNGLGEAAHAAGRHADATSHHTTAHVIAADTGDRDQQARAHAGLGHAHRALGNPAKARHHYQHALALYVALGTPAADEVRIHLATIDNNLSARRGQTTVDFEESPSCEGTGDCGVVT